MSTNQTSTARLRKAIRLAIGVATTATAGVALAFTGVPGFLEFWQGPTPTVVVRSTNGQLYNELVSGAQIATVTRGACEGEGNGNLHPVSSFSITAHDWPGQTAEAYLDALDHNANNLPEMEVFFPDGIYPQGVSYPQAWKDRVIAACNTNLNHQIGQGKSKDQVLGKVWELKGVPLDELKGTMFCGNAKAPGGFIEPGGVYERSIAASINVRCEKYSLDQVQATPKEPVEPPGASDDVKLKVGVTQAALVVLPGDYQGSCPAQLTASGTIVTNGPTKVSYRLENDKGQLSTVGTIDVDQTNTAYFVVKIAVGEPPPNPQGTLTTSTTGGGGSGNPNSTVAAVGVGGGGVAAGASVTAKAPPPNVAQGFWRLLTTVPNQVESKPASFKVTCTPSLKKQLATPTDPGRKGVFTPIGSIKAQGKQQDTSKKKPRITDGTSQTFMHAEHVPAPQGATPAAIPQGARPSSVPQQQNSSTPKRPQTSERPPSKQ